MYCIYHSVDLDGWCSAAIVKKWYEETQKEIRCDKCGQLQDKNHAGSTQCCGSTASYEPLELIGYNYGNPIPTLREKEKIIMVDISFPMEEMYKLSSSSGWNLIWIDHHKSAIKDYKEFIDDGETPFLAILPKNNELKAACELTWEYLFPELPIPCRVELLGLYDSFRHKNTSDEERTLLFQYGARAEFNSPESFPKWFFYTIDSAVLIQADGITNNGRAIYKYLCEEAKQSYKNGFTIELEEETGGDTDGDIVNPIFVEKRKFICLNKERFNPINFGIKYHEDGYDGAACFHYANGYYNFSLYNDNGKVDCSVIAKSFGGGGHKGAAGFRIKDINSIINN